MKGKDERNWRNQLLPVMLSLILTMSATACGRIPTDVQGTAKPTESPAEQTQEAADIPPGPGIATDSYGAVADAAGYYMEDRVDAVTAFFGNASDDEKAQMAVDQEAANPVLLTNLANLKLELGDDAAAEQLAKQAQPAEIEAFSANHRRGKFDEFSRLGRSTDPGHTGRPERFGTTSQ